MKRRTIKQNVWAWTVSLSAITMMTVYGCQSGGGKEDPQSATQTQIGEHEPVVTNHVECQRDRECTNPAKPVCSENTCVPCSARVFCGTGICDYPSGRCVECMQDQDCKVTSASSTSAVNGEALWGHLDTKTSIQEKGMCIAHVCVACDVTNCLGTCESGRCVMTEEVIPCEGDFCGIASPTRMDDIDPETRRIVNNASFFRVLISDMRALEKAPSVGMYKVEAHVNGLYATVTTEFTIVNENNRVMEGELEFPLPDDAVVSGYAIDVNGVMMPAQIVEKQRARVVFENEVRKGVDPGLVEQVKGNAYRTRIYPIPANGSRRVLVEYTTPLVIAPNGDAALALPMPQTKLMRRDISIDVVNQGLSAPAVGGLGDKRFTSAQAIWHVESHETDVIPKDNILVAMPNLADTIVSSEVYKNETFFVASVRTKDNHSKIKITNKWRIVWDASGSRTKRDIQKARQFLEELPEAGEFELHVFRNVLEPVQKISGRAKLLEAIDQLAYDGGTDFGSLTSLASKKFDGVTLFFTDGMDTMQGSLPQFGDSAVAMITGDARDVSSMRKICGGRTILLDINTGAEAMRQIASSPVVVSSVEGKNVSDVQGLGLPTAGRITVVGRVQQSGGNATLRLSDGSTVKIDIPKSDVEGKTLATAWAARRVDDLSPRADDHKEELLALGRRFSIVSPVSSMLVLEDLDQWLEYNIEPPASLAEVHRQWLDLRPSDAELAEEKEQTAIEWMDDLTRLWADRVRWWKQPKPKLKAQKPPVRNWDDDDDDWDDDNEFDGSGWFNPYVLDDDICINVYSSKARLIPKPAAAARMQIDDDLGERAPAAPAVRQPAASAPARMVDSDWNNYDSSAASSGAAYGMGAMGAGGGGAAMGGFGAGGAPGGGSAKAKSSSVRVAWAEDASYDEEGNVEGSIAVKEWDPSMPYLQAIKDAKTVYKTLDAAYKEYLHQREQYGMSPAFYFDCASYFFKEKEQALALRILSNLSELKIDDVALLRTYAWRLREAGDYDDAILVLRKVAKIRSDEAISWRDLALTLTMRGKAKKNAADVQEALELYRKVIYTPWYDEGIREDAIWVALQAIEEWNELAEWAKRQGLSGKIKMPAMDSKFRQNLAMDIRITMNWDADSTDIDLHVVEPSGYEVYYSEPCSPTGGMISHDIVTGYGPEEFLHKYAPKGDYTVMTKYFSSHQERLVGPATITVTFYTNWGRSNQKSETMTLRLEEENEKVKVGTYTLK